MPAAASYRASSAPTRDADALVHFAGPWSGGARRRLIALLQRIERVGDAPPVPRAAGKRWVCYCQPYGRDKAVYSVSRIGWSDALVAPTYDALLRALRVRA